jgi:hypothetical protein
VEIEITLVKDIMHGHYIRISLSNTTQMPYVALLQKGFGFFWT